MGEDGKKFENITGGTDFLSSLNRQGDLYSANDDLRPLRVVSIAVVDVLESTEIHLVAVLSNGTYIRITLRFMDF